MHPFIRVVPAVALSLAVFACSSSTAPTTTDSALTGTWSDTSLIHFESSFIMKLSAHDTIVTGTGTYAFEAGRSGTITVTGAIAGADILLTVTYDNGDIAHFSGMLQGSRTLRGSWWTTSDPIIKGFEKISP